MRSADLHFNSHQPDITFTARPWVWVRALPGVSGHVQCFKL